MQVHLYSPGHDVCLYNIHVFSVIVNRLRGDVKVSWSLVLRAAFEVEEEMQNHLRDSITA